MAVKKISGAYDGDYSEFFAPKEKCHYRHEDKFLISLPEAEFLQQKLSAVMTVDKHAIGGRYNIRSVYFDDYSRSAYNEKLMGVNKRKKYRIRYYNCDDSFIALECKRKYGAYIYKTSARITRQQFDMIMAGDVDFLYDSDNVFLREFYYEHTHKILRPATITEYERVPFVCDEGTVRITFDRNVRYTSLFTDDLFSSELPGFDVIDPGKTVLEVKFTEFMPAYIKSILRDFGENENTAVSKFLLCYEKSVEALPYSRWTY